MYLRSCKKLSDQESKKINLLIKSLLAYALGFKIQKEDAEEIVNDSVIKALDKFDNEKGDFESFCRFILKNLIFNFIRDNSDRYLYDYIDDEEKFICLFSYKDEFSYQDKDLFGYYRIFLSRLEKALDEKELELFRIIRTYSESSANISVKAASESMGLNSQKGWDLFRKIQRKAAELSKIKSEKEILTISHFYKFSDTTRQSRVHDYHSDEYSLHFNRLISRLNQSQLDKLSSLL